MVCNKCPILSACRVLLCLQAFSQVLPHSALTQPGWSTRLIHMNWVRAADSWGVPLFRLTEPYVCLRASQSRWPRASGTERDESLPPNSGKQTLIWPLLCLLLKHPSCTGDCVCDEWITLNVSHWVSRVCGGGWALRVLVEAVKGLGRHSCLCNIRNRTAFIRDREQSAVLTLSHLQSSSTHDRQLHVTLS